MRSSSTRTPPDASSSAATVLGSISTWLAPPARTAALAGSIPGPEPQVPGRQFYRLPHSRLHGWSDPSAQDLFFFFAYVCQSI
jgi:uncharacterized membrane protein YjjB (DUF3815 family)